ncbi:iron ABC transporter permease [Ectothiorhodospiraceae bacterium BW-2]|nr:iron ABC transporter permease [Ectothiorhodospiraceae bacterium BW-2]
MIGGYRVVWGGLPLLLLSLLSLTLGAEPLPLLETLQRWWSGEAHPFVTILVEIRLPRTLIALTAGAALGLAGAVMQGLLRNPLAAPELMGSASGAALGAVISLYFGLYLLWPLALPLGGVIGALLVTVVVYRLAGGGISTLTLILAGIAVNSLAMALISLLLNLAPSAYAVKEMLLWLLGSLANLSWHEFWLLLPGVGVGALLLWRSGRALDALTLGEESAATLGVDLTRLRLVVLVGTALTVGPVVAVCGAIGFIGLVVPHLMRLWVGEQPSDLLGVSALGGATLLLLADIVTRLLPTHGDLKVGVVTALLGAPLFLWLILRR